MSRGLQNPKVRPHSHPLNILSLSVSAQEIPVGRQVDLAGLANCSTRGLAWKYTSSIQINTREMGFGVCWCLINHSEEKLHEPPEHPQWHSSLPAGPVLMVDPGPIRQIPRLVTWSIPWPCAC